MVMQDTLHVMKSISLGAVESIWKVLGAQNINMHLTGIQGRRCWTDFLDLSSSAQVEPLFSQFSIAHLPVFFEYLHKYQNLANQYF